MTSSRIPAAARRHNRLCQCRPRRSAETARISSIATPQSNSRVGLARACYRPAMNPGPHRAAAVALGGLIALAAAMGVGRFVYTPRATAAAR